MRRIWWVLGMVGCGGVDVAMPPAEPPAAPVQPPPAPVRQVSPGTYTIDSIPGLPPDTIFAGEYQGARYEWFGWRASAWAKREPCGPFESALAADTTLWSTYSQLIVTADSIHSLIHVVRASWWCRQTVPTVVESWSRSPWSRSDLLLPVGSTAVGLGTGPTLWFSPRR